MMTATERAYAFTKRRILDGRFAGGALISEADVAEGVRLSRTPVREAFVRLESEGLLRLYPKRGALVVPVSAEEVESVMETRAARRAPRDREGHPRRAPRCARAWTARSRRQEDLAARDATPAFVEADRGFHRISSRPPATRSCSRSTTRCATARAAWASSRSRATRSAPGRSSTSTARSSGPSGAGDEAGALAVLEAHLGTTLALLRAAPAEPSGD